MNIYQMTKQIRICEKEIRLFIAKEKEVECVC